MLQGIGNAYSETTSSFQNISSITSAIYIQHFPDCMQTFQTISVISVLSTTANQTPVVAHPLSSATVTQV